MMVTVISITRKHTERLNNLSGHLLIYGRRKVGKTYLVKNFLDHDIYYIVKRGGGIISEKGVIKPVKTYEGFIENLRANLDRGKTIVVDEFQRLPDDFLDHVQSFGDNGRLILTGSSFHIIKDILSPNSPILGMVSEFKLSLITPENIFCGLSDHLSPDEAFGSSPYLRDPWTLQYFDKENTDLSNILFFSKQTVQSLLGEVFLEEERKLSSVYEGIIRSLAVGKWKMKEISDLLYSRRLISGPEPSNIRPYFKNMMSMDLVKRIPLHHKKGYKYMIKSPIMELAYLLDEKVNFFEEDVPEKRVKDIIEDVKPEHIEQFCGEYFAECYGGKFEYFYSSDFDIDFIITYNGEVLASGAVKWSENVSKKDAERFLERTDYLQGDKIFFSKKKVDVEGVKSYTPSSLLELIH